MARIVQLAIGSVSVSVSDHHKKKHTLSLPLFRVVQVKGRERTYSCLFVCDEVFSHLLKLDLQRILTS